jgi:hypothetical protein
MGTRAASDNRLDRHGQDAHGALMAPTASSSASTIAMSGDSIQGGEMY